MTVSRALNEYIRSEKFKARIVRQYGRFEILSEGGLRTAIANELRGKLRVMGVLAAKHYRVTCENRLGEVIPDITIWKNGDSRFIIEIKATRTFNQSAAKADRKKLQEFCRNCRESLKGGYLIYVARTGKAAFPIRRSRDSLRLWPIPIFLKKEMRRDFDDWYKEYKQRARYSSAPALTKAASGS